MQIYKIGLVGVLSLYALQTGNAWRRYLKRIPNSARVPCDSKFEQCFGTNICEAFGHDACAPNGDENTFGKDFEREEFWDNAFCAQDSDGDGASNGDELGDMCCTWNMANSGGGAGEASGIFRSSDLSDPAIFQASHSVPSCIQAPPSAPSNVTITGTSLAWTTANSCQCGITATITAVGSSTALATIVWKGGVGSQEMSGTICGLSSGSSGSTLEVTLGGFNLAGDGATASQQFTATTAMEAACSSSESKDNLMNTAGRVRKEFPELWTSYVPLVGWIVVCVGIGCVLLWKLKDPSPVRRALLHRKRLPLPSNAALRYAVQDWFDHTRAGQLFAWGLLAAIVGGIVLAYQWFNSQVYAYDNAGVVGRSTGSIGLLMMGLSMLPVSRHGLAMIVLGIPFDRAIMFHKMMGAFTFLLILIHGIVMAVRYATSEIGFGQLWKWDTEASQNVLPGTIAGILMIVMGVGAMAWVRRWKYGVFLITHVLAIPVVIFSVLHLASSFALAPIILFPTLGLVVFDVIVQNVVGVVNKSTLIGVSLLRPSDQVAKPMQSAPSANDAATPSGSDEDPGDDVAADADVNADTNADADATEVGQEEAEATSGQDGSKDNAVVAPKAQVQVTTPGIVAAAQHDATAYVALLFAKTNKLKFLKLKPGHFVYISAPSISPAPHPITVSAMGSLVSGNEPFAEQGGPIDRAVHQWRELSTVESHEKDVGRQWYTVHVKSNGPGTWTGKLCAAMEKTITDGEKPPSFTIMGPFGSPSVQYHRYQHVVLLAGGVGVTPIAAVANELRDMYFKPGAERRVGSVTVVWAMRDPALAAAMLPLVHGPADNAANPDMKWETHLHLTRPATTPADAAAMQAVGQAPCVQLENGRPNVPAVLNGLAESLVPKEGEEVLSVAVVVCGPQALVNSVRDATNGIHGRTDRVAFDVHEEHFSW